MARIHPVTVADYRTFTGDESVAVAPVQLRLAAARVESAIRFAGYATDDDGFPSDPKVIEACRDAACTQVAWWLARGDKTGLGRAEDGLSSLSIKGLAWSRDKDAEKATELCTDARGVLQAAGLTQVIVRPVRGLR